MPIVITIKLFHLGFSNIAMAPAPQYWFKLVVAIAIASVDVRVQYEVN